MKIVSFLRDSLMEIFLEQTKRYLHNPKRSLEKNQMLCLMSQSVNEKKNTNFPILIVE